MKAKMDEIDEIWVIYRRNLGQNSRWNINLLLKINFSCWIKNWEQSGRWIAILPLKSHLGRQITLHEGGEISPKNQRYISNISLIYHRYITDISPIYHWYITDISPIFCHQRRFFEKISDISPIFTEISPLRFFSMKYRVDPSRYTIYQRYIADISRYFPPC